MRQKELANQGLERTVNPCHALALALGVTDEEDGDGVPVQYTGDIGTVALAMAMGNLTDREMKVMYHRYFHGEDYETIGERFGVTRERIRQVERKALRKMGRRNVLELIRGGILSYWRSEIDREAEKRFGAYKTALDREFADRVRTWEETHRAEALPDKDQALLDAADDRDSRLRTPIEEMDLSVRSYNCLKRAGLNTAGDIARRSHEQMMRVRNLGRKSLEEVIGKLDGMGLRLSDEPETVIPSKATDMHRCYATGTYYCPACLRALGTEKKHGSEICHCGVLLNWKEAE